jgi:hypothetical protein
MLLQPHTLLLQPLEHLAHRNPTSRHKCWTCRFNLVLQILLANRVAGHSCQHVKESVTAKPVECSLDDEVQLTGPTPDSEDGSVAFPLQTRVGPLQAPSHRGGSAFCPSNQMVSPLLCQDIIAATSRSYWYFPVCRTRIDMARRCKSCKVSLK